MGLFTADLTRLAADQTAIAQQNSQDAATSVAGINALIASHQTFDASIQAITFPPGARADVIALLNADTALENGYSLLAANRNTVSNYNSIFTTVVPLQTAFNAALTTVGRDVGRSDL